MILLSKIIALITQPLYWVALVLAASVLVYKKPRLQRGLSAFGLALLLAIGWQPLPDYLLRALESQNPEVLPDADLSRFVGVLVLGGSSEPGYVAATHRHPQTNAAAERLIASVALLRRNPQLPIVFTGGEGRLLGEGPSEAQRAQDFFDSMGVPRTQVRYESASRNTYENASFSANLPGVDKTQAWLIITSAFHMPRAMATFSKAGWNVSAYPVDFRTGDATPWSEYSLRDAVDHWQIALHEWVGTLAYRVAGRL